MHINIVSILQGMIMIGCGIWKYHRIIEDPMYKVGVSGVSIIAIFLVIFSNLPKLQAAVLGPILLSIFSIIIIASGTEELDNEY